MILARSIATLDRQRQETVVIAVQVPTIFDVNSLLVLVRHSDHAAL